jgi:hypothetical protein
MTEADAYLTIAERALSAADGALAKGIHEKAAFLGYHAFESIGGAFCRKRGVVYPNAHQKKIDRFIQESKHEKRAKQVTMLAIAYGSLRNQLRYPQVFPGGVIKEPRTVISDAQTKRLVGRTDSLVNWIKTLL